MPPYYSQNNARSLISGDDTNKGREQESPSPSPSSSLLVENMPPVLPAPKAPRIAMKKNELAEWQKWYKTPESLQVYLRQQANDPKGLLENFYQTLAQLMFYMFDSSFYHICYDNHYVWEMCIPGDENGSVFDVEQGSIMRLCIVDCNGKLQPYVHIGKSAFGGLGVFATREFPKGALLGLYQGPRIWEAGRIGTDAPTDEYLASQGVNSSPCLCSIRDNQGRMAVYAPERIPLGDDPQPLYMGMHYMKGVEEKEVTCKPNCEIVEDGGVVTHFAIPENTELICGVLEED